MVLTRSKAKLFARAKPVHSPSKMTTRSQSIKQYKRPNYVELDVDIDFDEASNAWTKNKIKTGNGCYRYKK
jgi:hypothetical protein